MALRKKLELDITQYRRRLDEAKRATRRFSREARSASDDVQGGMTGAADASARSWSSASDRIRSTLRGLAGAVAAVFSVQAIRTFAERLIGANREIEDAATRLRAVVDDDRAPALLESIREFTARTPFELTQVTNAFALLVGSGLDAERMIQTVADTAAASGRSIEDAARAVGDAMQGQVSRLRDLGVGIRRIGDDAVQVFDREGNEQLFAFDPSDQRSFRDAVQSALAAAFDGAAERLSKTVSGRLSTLADAFREELAEAGRPLFEAFGEGVEDLTSRLQAGEFQAALSRMAEVVGAIFRTMKALVSVSITLGPPLIAAATAMASFRVVDSVVGSFKAIRENAERSRQIIEDQISALRSAQGLMQQGALLPDGRVGAGVTSQQRDQVLRAQDALHRFDLTVSDVAENTQAYQQTLVGLAQKKAKMGSVVRRLGARLKAFAASLLSPQLILAALTAAVTFIIQRRRAAARALEEMLRPIKEMREEAEGLIENLRRLEPSALVSRLRTVEIDLEINQEQLVAAEDRLEALRDERESFLFSSGGLSEAEQRGRVEAIRREEAETQAEIEEREKAITAQKEAQARAQTAVSRSVLATLEAKDQEIQKIKETLDLTEDEQLAVDNLNRARLAALDRGDTGRAAQAQREIDRILDRAAVEREAAEERIAALEEERAVIEARARALGLLDDEEEPADTGEETEQRQVAITREFRRQLELLERQRGLHGRALDEAAAAASAQERIWRLMDRRAELQEAIADGTADSTEQAQGEVRALDEIITREEDRMALAERRQRLLETLSASELALIDELGGLDEALSGVDFEDIVDFAPILRQMQRVTQEMEDEITRATASGMVAGLSDEEVREKLDEIAKRHQESIKDLLQSIDLSSLPPELVRLLAPFLRSIEESADEAGRLWENIQAAGRSLRSLGRAARVLGVISRSTQDIVSGLSDAVMSAADFGRALKEARAENEDMSFGSFLTSAEGMTAAIGVVSGIASVIGSIASASSRRRDAERRMAEEMERLRQSILDSSIRIASAVQDFTRAARVGGGITGQQTDQALDLLDAVQRFRRLGDRPDLPGRGDDTPRRPGAPRDPVEGPRRGAGGTSEDDFLAFLEDLMELDLEGIDAARFRDLFQDLLDSGMGVRQAIERVFDSGLDDMLRALEEDLLGRSVEGAIEGMELMREFFGKDLPQAFDFFLSFLLDDVEGISAEAKALLEEAQTLDISTAEGRRRLEEIAAVFAAAAMDRDTGFLGGLTPDEAQRIAETILGAEVEERGVTRSTQVARAITEWQAAIVIDLLSEQAQTLHDIRDIIDRPPDAALHPVTFGDIHITEAQDGQRIAEELQRHINRKRLG